VKKQNSISQMDINEYGNSTKDRIDFLVKELTNKEKNNYFRLESFITIWAASTGGMMDINEHNSFFQKTNIYALRQIDAIFFKHFGVHIEKNPHKLEMTDEEWKNGLKAYERT